MPCSNVAHDTANEGKNSPKEQKNRDGYESGIATHRHTYEIHNHGKEVIAEIPKDVEDKDKHSSISDRGSMEVAIEKIGVSDRQKNEVPSAREKTSDINTTFRVIRANNRVGNKRTEQKGDANTRSSDSDVFLIVSCETLFPNAKRHGLTIDFEYIFVKKKKRERTQSEKNLHRFFEF